MGYNTSKSQWLSNNQALEQGSIPESVNRELNRMAFEAAMDPNGRLLDGSTLLGGVVSLGQTAPPAAAWEWPSQQQSIPQAGPEFDAYWDSLSPGERAITPDGTVREKQ